MIYSIGDTIKWIISKDHSSKHFRGKTCTAKIAMVDEDSKDCGVYPEHGVDLVPFEQASRVMACYLCTKHGEKTCPHKNNEDLDCRTSLCNHYKQKE